MFATYLDLPQYQGATGADPNRSANFADGTGGLVAGNRRGRRLGQVGSQITMLVVGGATVANNVVFTAGLDGYFRAYDAETGQELWNYEAETGFNAPPAIAGDMVFAAAGFAKLPPAGSAPAASPEAEVPAPVAKLIAFRLGGAAPATPRTEATSAPTTAPEPTATEAPSAATSGEAAASVAMHDIFFDPKEITIAANTDVTITLTNKGAAVHNFNIDALNVHSGDYQPGQTGTFTSDGAGLLCYPYWEFRRCGESRLPIRNG